MSFAIAQRNVTKTTATSGSASHRSWRHPLPDRLGLMHASTMVQSGNDPMALGQWQRRAGEQTPRSAGRSSGDGLVAPTIERSLRLRLTGGSYT